MNTSVVYPVGIAPALGHLNSTRNDIEIFVEDTSSLNVWRKLLKKFLPAGVVFNDPIPLGGRDRVLQECRNDQRNDGRKKLYIIDADLDLVKGLGKPRLKHLYRLRAYCIENYLFHEDTLLELAQVLDVNASAADARARLDFQNWISQNSGAIRKLYNCYAVTSLLRPDLPTISYFVGRLCVDDSRDGILCKVKVNSRLMHLYREIRAVHSRDTLRDCLSKIESNSSKMSVLVFVSAKDCLFKLAYERLTQKFGSMRPDHMKVLMAEFTQVSVDPYLRARLHKICNN